MQITGFDMNSEFHYYITYILAYRAGFSREMASKIAYSSQFVDDNNVNRWYLEFADKKKYTHLVTQSLSPWKIKKLANNNIYLYFHFMPGDISNQSLRRDRKYHPLTTTAGCDNAIKCLQYALHSNNPYLIGIATHTYADTWAHQNFVGLFSDFNSSQGLLATLIPNIGHADFLHKPDMINLTWEDDRLLNQQVSNHERFIQAAGQIFTAYRLKLKPACPLLKAHKEALLKNLSYCMKPTQEVKRVELYKSLAKFYSNKAPFKYKCSTWHQQSWQRKWLNSDWFNFQQAAKMHYNFASNLLNKQITHAKQLFYY